VSREEWGGLWALLSLSLVFWCALGAGMLLAGIFAWHSHLWVLWFTAPPALTWAARWYARRQM
jgi:hypothetical protein